MEQFKLFTEGEQERAKYDRSDIIILSFQPYAYERIKSGVKQMEYRTRFRKRASIAFIYVSRPVKEIRGIMFLSQPIIATPEDIGKIAEKHIAGNGGAVYEYLKNSKQAYAIPIERYVEIEPLPLQMLREKYGFVAPQSYTGVAYNKKLEEYLLGLVRSIDKDLTITA